VVYELILVPEFEYALLVPPIVNIYPNSGPVHMEPRPQPIAIPIKPTKSSKPIKTDDINFLTQSLEKLIIAAIT
jgi:hypothetical protein